MVAFFSYEILNCRKKSQKKRVQRTSVREGVTIYRHTSQLQLFIVKIYYRQIASSMRFPSTMGAESSVTSSITDVAARRPLLCTIFSLRHFTIETNTLSSYFAIYFNFCIVNDDIAVINSTRIPPYNETSTKEINARSRFVT